MLDAWSQLESNTFFMYYSLYGAEVYNLLSPIQLNKAPFECQLLHYLLKDTTYNFDK